MGCICGTCAHEPLSKCTCGYAQEMRTNLRAQVDLGKNRDEIIEHFIRLYGGQHFLMSPLDRGFNRLAWIVPYALAGAGAILVGFVATRVVPPAGWNGGGSRRARGSRHRRTSRR